MSDTSVGHTYYEKMKGLVDPVFFAVTGVLWLDKLRSVEVIAGKGPWINGPMTHQAMALAGAVNGGAIYLAHLIGQSKGNDSPYYKVMLTIVGLTIGALLTPHVVSKVLKSHSIQITREMAFRITAFNLVAKVAIYVTFKKAEQYYNAWNFPTFQDFDEMTEYSVRVLNSHFKGHENIWKKKTFKEQLGFNRALHKYGLDPLPINEVDLDVSLTKNELEMFRKLYEKGDLTPEQATLLYNFHVAPQENRAYKAKNLPIIDPRKIKVENLEDEQIRWHHEWIIRNPSEVLHPSQIRAFVPHFYRLDLLPPSSSFVTELPLPKQLEGLSAAKVSYLAHFYLNNSHKWDELPLRDQIALKEAFAKHGLDNHPLREPTIDELQMSFIKKEHLKEFKKHFKEDDQSVWLVKSRSYQEGFNKVLARQGMKLLEIPEQPWSTTKKVIVFVVVPLAVIGIVTGVTMFALANRAKPLQDDSGQGDETLDQTEGSNIFPITDAESGQANQNSESSFVHDRSGKAGAASDQIEGKNISHLTCPEPGPTTQSSGEVLKDEVLTGDSKRSFENGSERLQNRPGEFDKGSDYADADLGTDSQSLEAETTDTAQSSVETRVVPGEYIEGETQCVLEDDAKGICRATRWFFEGLATKAEMTSTALDEPVVIDPNAVALVPTNSVLEIFSDDRELLGNVVSYEQIFMMPDGSGSRVVAEVSLLNESLTTEKTLEQEVSENDLTGSPLVKADAAQKGDVGGEKTVSGLGQKADEDVLAESPLVEKETTQKVDVEDEKSSANVNIEPPGESLPVSQTPPTAGNSQSLGQKPAQETETSYLTWGWGLGIGSLLLVCAAILKSVRPKKKEELLLTIPIILTDENLGERKEGGTGGSGVTPPRLDEEDTISDTLPPSDISSVLPGEDGEHRGSTLEMESDSVSSLPKPNLTTTSPENVIHAVVSQSPSKRTGSTRIGAFTDPRDKRRLPHDKSRVKPIPFDLDLVEARAVTSQQVAASSSSQDPVGKTVDFSEHLKAITAIDIRNASTKEKEIAPIANHVAILAPVQKEIIREASDAFEIPSPNYVGIRATRKDLDLPSYTQLVKEFVDPTNPHELDYLVVDATLETNGVEAFITTLEKESVLKLFEAVMINDSLKLMKLRGFEKITVEELKTLKTKFPNVSCFDLNGVTLEGELDGTFKDCLILHEEKGNWALQEERFRLGIAEKVEAFKNGTHTAFDDLFRADPSQNPLGPLRLFVESIDFLKGLSISDSFIKTKLHPHLLKNFPNIRLLDLTGCSELTLESFKKLAVIRIESLILEGCKKIFHRDSQTIARSKQVAHWWVTDAPALATVGQCFRGIAPFVRFVNLYDTHELNFMEPNLVKELLENQIQGGDMLDQIKKARDQTAHIQYRSFTVLENMISIMEKTKRREDGYRLELVQIGIKGQVGSCDVSARN